MKKIYILLSALIFTVGCNDMEPELNNDVYEAFKKVLILEPNKICQDNCNEWDNMTNNEVEIKEWGGQKSITTTGYFRSGSVPGRSWISILLNEEKKQASLRAYMWIADTSPVEDIYYIDFRNNPFINTGDDFYGVGFYGDESQKGTKRYRAIVQFFPENNYITFRAYGGPSASWDLGAKFYFDDEQNTKDKMDELVNAVKALREYQNKDFFDRLFS